MKNDSHSSGARQRRGRTIMVSAASTVLVGVVALLIFAANSLWFRDIGYAERTLAYQAVRGKFDAQSATRIMALGSSKTQCAIASEVLAKTVQDECGHPVFAFNFSVPGSIPTNHLLSLHRLIRDGNAPDFLILELTPIFLKDSHPQFNYWDLEPDERALLTEIGVKLSHDRAEDRLRMSWYEKRHILLAMTRVRWNPRDLSFATKPANDSWGDLIRPTVEVPPAVRTELFKFAIQAYGEACREVKIGGVQMNALKKMLALADRAGIPCALLITPEGEAMQGLYSPAVRQSMAELIAEIRATWNVPLFDTRQWLPGDNHYSDSHHVIRRSAVEITERLAREMVIPWLKKIESSGTRENPFRTTSR